MSQTTARSVPCTTIAVSAAVAAAAIVFSACSRAPEQPRTTDTPTNSAASIARGAEVFGNQCANCHGSTGKGDGPSAVGTPVKPRDLTAEPYRFVPLSDERTEVDSLIEYISTGRIESGMPPYNGLLTQTELESVALFVESIRPQPKFIDADEPEGG